MLIFNPNRCPECGEPPDRQLDTILAHAKILYDSDTESLDWDGYTEVLWDTQKPVTKKDRKVTLLCCNDHEWKAEAKEEHS